MFNVVFLNGRQVFEQATSTKVLEADIVRTITYKTKGELERPIDFYRGQTEAGSPVLGWSRTFPGHHISTNALVGVVEELINFFENRYRNRIIRKNTILSRNYGPSSQ